MSELFEDLNPPQRLLMGPGPINAHPRVLRRWRAAARPVRPEVPRVHGADLGALPRRVPDRRTAGRCWSTAPRAPAIEAALVSLIEPGDRVLVPVFGRFGHLKVEIARRCGADVRAIETEWGTVFAASSSRRQIQRLQPEDRGRLPRRHLDHDGAAAGGARASCAASTTRCSTSTRPRRSAAWTCRPTPGTSTW